jgi:hypothetical protein
VEVRRDAGEPVDGECGKLTYRTAPAAWEAMRRLRGRGHRGGRKVGNVYRCRFCHAWHVSRIDDWRERR